MSNAQIADSAAQCAIIVVFARLPVPGKVKTRLAAGVGPDAAAAFYKLCAEHACLEVLRCPAADGVVFCAAAEDVAGVTGWLAAAGAALPVQPQVQDPDLGRRMVAALTAAATGRGAAQLQAPVGCAAADSPPQQGPASPAYAAAVVIGTDIPDLSSEVLSGAVEMLLGPPGGGTAAGAAAAGGGAAVSPPADMVLGPAADGGYYLLGLRTEALLRPDVQSGKVFEGVEWSCSSVLQKTVAAAEQLGLRVAAKSLPQLRDIDTLQDAGEWLRRCSISSSSSSSSSSTSSGGGQAGSSVPGLQHQQQQRQHHTAQMLQLVKEWL